MRVSDSARVLFVHVQKTGGSTVDHIFDREVADARRVGNRSRHTPYAELLKTEPQLEDYWSFGFVRNPWARMVSWFSMISSIYQKYEAGDPKVVAKFERFPGAWLPHQPYSKDFDKFVLEGADAVEKVGRPQVDMLRTRDGLEVDFVGRTESFVPDLNVVRERLGLAALEEVPRKNSSSHGHYSEYYNETTREKVAQLYARDIEAYGYTYEQR